jgi:hypothetical protein
LGQLISGVADNSVRIKLLELGDALTLDQALTILRSAEKSQLQAASLQQNDHFASVCERETLIVGSIQVQQVGVTIGKESMAISVAAHPNGPTVTIQGPPDTGSQLEAIPHSPYRISSTTRQKSLFTQGLPLPPLPETPACVLDHSPSRTRYLLDIF